MKEPAKKRQLAVALTYERQMPAPQVAASGYGEVARRIIALATEHGVPLVENTELAEALAQVPIAETIPPELYSAVASILAYLYRLDQVAKRAP